MTKKKRNQKQVETEINFTKSLDNVTFDIFAPPKNPKSLLLPANKAPNNTKLPEDCHYQPEDLVKLFLLPNLKVYLNIHGLSFSFLLFKLSIAIYLCDGFSFCSALGKEEESCQVIFYLMEIITQLSF